MLSEGGPNVRLQIRLDPTRSRRVWAPDRALEEAKDAVRAGADPADLLGRYPITTILAACKGVLEDLR